MGKTLFACLILTLAMMPPAHAAAKKSARKAETATVSAEAATSDTLQLFEAGEALAARGDFAQAEDLFFQAWERERAQATLTPETRRKLTVRVGLARLNNMQVDAAVELFRQASTDDPAYPLYHYHLASAYAFADHARKVESESLDGAGDLDLVDAQGIQTRVEPEDIFRELQLAYDHAGALGPGEKIPNPRTDVFLGRLRHEPRFQEILEKAGPAAQADLEADLEAMTKAGEDTDPDQAQAVAEQIEASPAHAAEVLMRRLGRSGLSQPQRVATIWALGRTGDARASEALLHLLAQPGAEELKGPILEAVSRIGGAQAGNALILEYRDARDENERLGLLTLLANMQFEPALPLMAEFLHQNTQQAAYQMMYCFGKMGDKAVPMLLNRLYDTDKTVRMNSINMIHWLCPSKAMIPMQRQFQLEKDPEVRVALIGCLGALMRPDQFGPFLQNAIGKEKDEEVRSQMEEMLEQLEDVKDAFSKFKAAKTQERAKWDKAYDTLFKSCGRAGSFEDLERASTPEDEPALSRLRVRILDRQSDECFADYMHVNQIIAFNRMLGD